PIMVRGDRGVPYGRVVEAMVLLQAGGAPSVGLVTESPEK
ncbi:MAG: protein TolR, partial [Candidatus Thiodiazotropha taylori]|nr:protein TolR [Candidatus Thiodiazotropha taylori]MCW4245843.1 protein TolR [Candidatus Thiodiazotropha taylori]